MRRNCTIPERQGFRPDTDEKKGRRDFFKNGWTARHTGDRICFQFLCSCIAVQYRKTIHRPAPAASLILDGDTAHPVSLDSNFSEDWGDCLYLCPILHHGVRKVHTVEIEITGTDPGDLVPFYLLSIITAG